MIKIQTTLPKEKKKPKKKSNKTKLIIWLVISILLIFGLAFGYWAEKKELPANIHPGRYVVKNGISNNQLVNMLRGGLQTPVKVTFNNIRDIDQLAGRIATQIEADSISISNLLHNQELILLHQSFHP